MHHGVNVSLGDGFDTRYAEDLALFAEHGLHDVRLPFDWATLQPKAGAWNGEQAEWYRHVFDAADSVGVRVWAALFDRTAAVPGWFADERGFLDERATGRFWPRWVDAVTDAFGDRVAGWFPFDDPVGRAAEAAGDDSSRHQEAIIILITAWRESWRILRGGPPVATSLAAFGPKMTNDWWSTIWLRGMRDGVLAVPGRMERELADLDGSTDIVGLRLAVDGGTEGWERLIGDVLQRAAEDLPDHPLAIAQLAVKGPDADEQGILFEATSAVLDDAASSGIDMAVAFTPFGHLFTRDRDPRPTLTAWSHS
jgi:hypothetical protein